MEYPDEKQIYEDLKKLRDDDSEIILALNPSTVWILVFQLQMVIRYLLTDKELADETREIVKDIQASLDEHPLYTECLKQALDLGWDADFDGSVQEHFNRDQQVNNN